MTPKMSRAVNNYIKGMSQTEALRQAGYTEASCQSKGHEIFKREDVKALVASRQKRIAKRSDLTPQWVMERLMMIADANLGEVLEWDENNTPIMRWESMPPELLYALGGLKVRTYTKGRGKDAIPVTEFEPKFEGKIKALELLARTLGMLQDKVKIEAEDSLIEQLQAGRSRASLAMPADPQADVE